MTCPITTFIYDTGYAPSIINCYSFNNSKRFLVQINSPTLVFKEIEPSGKVLIYSYDNGNTTGTLDFSTFPPIYSGTSISNISVLTAIPTPNIVDITESGLDPAVYGKYCCGSVTNQGSCPMTVNRYAPSNKNVQLVLFNMINAPTIWVALVAITVSPGTVLTTVTLNTQQLNTISAVDNSTTPPKKYYFDVDFTKLVNNLPTISNYDNSSFVMDKPSSTTQSPDFSQSKLPLTYGGMCCQKTNLSLGLSLGKLKITKSNMWLWVLVLALVIALVIAIIFTFRKK